MTRTEQVTNLEQVASQIEFPRGSKVVDRDGFQGSVVGIYPLYEGNFCYEVRFSGGVAVRYRGELKGV